MKTRENIMLQETGLLDEMTRMVEEANSLRDEAAQKMDGVPKAYELTYSWKEIITFVLTGVLAVAWMWCFGYWMDHDYYIPVTISVVVLGVAMMVASAFRNRPYKVEDSTKDYYVNKIHYDALKAELQRLQDGIADYDRQYEEQKEYIQKFRDLDNEVMDYAGTMRFVMKAGDFHAEIKMADDMDEVDCRLRFTPDGYEQLLGMLKYFNSKSR